MSRTVSLLLALAACSEKSPPEETPYCDREMSQIAGALEATLAAPVDMRGEAFELATQPFTQASMCGPDVAQVVRDLRDHFKARGSDAERRALLVRFDKEARYWASKKWRMPAKLATQIEAAR